MTAGYSYKKRPLHDCLVEALTARGAISAPVEHPGYTVLDVGVDRFFVNCHVGSLRVGRSPTDSTSLTNGPLYKSLLVGINRNIPVTRKGVKL